MSESFKSEERAPAAPEPVPPREARRMTPLQWSLVAVLLGILSLQGLLIAMRMHGSEYAPPGSVPVSAGGAYGPPPDTGPAGAVATRGDAALLMASADRLAMSLVRMDAQSATAITKAQAVKLLPLMNRLSEAWGREFSAGAQFYQAVRSTLSRSQMGTVMRFRRGLPAPPSGTLTQPGGRPAGAAPTPSGAVPGPTVPGPGTAAPVHTLRFPANWAMAQLFPPSPAGGAPPPPAGARVPPVPPPMLTSRAPGRPLPGSALPAAGGDVDGLVVKLARTAGEKPESVAPATHSGRLACVVAAEDIAGLVVQLGHYGDLTREEARALLPYARAYQAAHDETANVKKAMLEVLTPAQRDFLNQDAIAPPPAPSVGGAAPVSILDLLTARAK